MSGADAPGGAPRPEGGAAEAPGSASAPPGGDEGVAQEPGADEPSAHEPAKPGEAAFELWAEAARELPAEEPGKPAAAPEPAPAGAPVALLERVIEYFTLRRALAIEARLGERARAELAAALALGIQRAEAAEALWENGHSAEGLRLGVAALDATLAVASLYARAIGIAPGAEAGALCRAALSARGLSPDAIASIESALADARAASLPLYERDVAPAHTVLFRRVAEAQHRVARAFRDAARTRRELRFQSGTRIANAVLLAALATAGIWLATRTPEGVFAEASGTWADADMFSAQKAIDGRPDTLWIAPDGVEATLNVRISPPRRVQRIRLLNGTNPPHHDRGTRDYTLEVYAGGRLVRTIDGTLEHRTVGEPEYVEHEIAVDGVERIRFVARTYYRIGAGLAELQFD
jgi:hypothetical protein